MACRECDDAGEDFKGHSHRSLDGFVRCSRTVACSGNVVVGGELAGNGSGPLSIDSPLSVELYRVSMLAPTKSSGISFSGILGERQDEILDLLVRQQKAVLIDPVERQTELQD